MASPSDVLCLPADPVGFQYDRAQAPVARVRPGARVRFRTLDARSGALYHNPKGALIDLPLPPVGRGNPVTGPLAVEGAEPGDALAIDIHAIQCDDIAWSGGHKTTPIFAPDSGRIPRSRVRICDVRDSIVQFSERIQFPLRPMIGCIATAPAGEAVSCGLPGPFGGNLDHPVVCPGARVYLPVRVPEALLWVGDVHAAQGDGELSGVAVEVGAQVDLTVDLVKGRSIAWPWVENAEKVMVLTCAPTFEEARRDAVDALLRAVEDQLGMEPAEAFGFVTAVGDLRIGQACGFLPITLRLEMPRTYGITPQ